MVEKKDSYIAIFIAFIMLCYSGPFASYKGSLVLIATLGLLLLMQHNKIIITKKNDIWKSLLFYLSINSLFNLPYSLNYMLVFVVGFLLMNRKNKISDYKIVFSCIKIVSVIEVFTILIQFYFSNIYYKYAKKWFFYSNQYQQVEYLGKYCKKLSGLYYEVSFAALIVSFGIILFFIDLLETKKKKTIVLLIGIMLVSYFSITLTAKRSFMIIIPFELVLLFFVKTKNKFNFKQIILIFAGTAILLLYFNNIEYKLDEILTKGNSDGVELSGREKFWDIAKQMFAEKPIWGTGLNSFDIWLNNSGIRSTQYDFAGAHNSYLQLLGETGIIGFILYVSAIISILVIGIKRVYKGVNEEKFILSSLGILILLLIYALSGNSLYQPQQLIAFFWCASTINNINYENSNKNL